MILSVEGDDGDGKIQLPEFLKLVSDLMNDQVQDEEVVELFKAFGASDQNGIITCGDFDRVLKESGESLKDDELNLIFEELAGQTKRQTLPAEKRFERQHGITFHDFLLLLLPK